ncbi:MAG: ferredoxin reductase family protein [Acidimicrobiales bacterium]
MTTSDQTIPHRRPSWSTIHPTRRPSSTEPRPLIANALAGLAGLGLGAVLAFYLANESLTALTSPGGWFLAVGRLSAFVGTYLLIVMLVLIARVPGLERAVGQDRLVRWHRRLGPWPVSLIALHVVTITVGYAELGHNSVLAQVSTFVLHYPDLLASAVGFGLLVMAAVSSHRLARRAMRYETWWVVHLYTYLAIALAFTHQVRVGVPFLTHVAARNAWIALWVATALVVVAYRVVAPLARNWRHQFRVIEVVEEAPGVHSLTIKGHELERLAVAGGQFFQWRFLTPGLWWHSHPYSLSAMPRPPFLRVTVKAIGDQSRALAHVRPGTRVFAEGPYGTFTHHALNTRRAVLIGAGVGVTPLRALLEDLPNDVAVSVIVRASRPEDLVHRDEIAALVEARHGQFHELIGPRHQVRFDARQLRRLVPDIAQRDVYICGPDGFADLAHDAATRAGAAPDHVHVEAFAF